jgi:hypothetical protein
MIIIIALNLSTLTSMSSRTDHFEIRRNTPQSVSNSVGRPEIGSRRCVETKNFLIRLGSGNSVVRSATRHFIGNK